MKRATYALAAVGLLLSGAIFGFFYAWVCSTMWGLDAIDPRIAIPAMQAMNASVRNAVFAPAFFGTPFVLLATAGFAWISGLQRAAMPFALAGIVYLVGAMMVTLSVNVPMNEALGALEVPAERANAAYIWAEYSPRWQMFNILRTIVSGVALLLTGWGVVRLARSEVTPRVA